MAVFLQRFEIVLWKTSKRIDHVLYVCEFCGAFGRAAEQRPYRFRFQCKAFHLNSVIVANKWSTLLVSKQLPAASGLWPLALTLEDPKPNVSCFPFIRQCRSVLGNVWFVRAIVQLTSSNSIRSDNQHRTIGSTQLPNDCDDDDIKSNKFPFRLQIVTKRRGKTVSFHFGAAASQTTCLDASKAITNVNYDLKKRFDEQRNVMRVVLLTAVLCLDATICQIGSNGTAEIFEIHSSQLLEKYFWIIYGRSMWNKLE